MELPWNIRGSASQLLFQDKTSLQHQALLTITDLPHPDRSILGGFINDAFDPQEAAQYFLQMTCAEEGSEIPPKKTKSQFLSEWTSLVEKFKPIQATSLSRATKMLVFERDGCRCCLTHTPFKSYLDHDLAYVHMVSPHVLADPDLSEGVCYNLTKITIELTNMPVRSLWDAGQLLSRDLLEVIRDHQHEQKNRFDNIWLLSKQAFEAVQAGSAFLDTQSWRNYPDPTQQQGYWICANNFQPQLPWWTFRKILLESKTPQLAPIISKDLVNIHALFSQSLAWTDTKCYMEATLKHTTNKTRTHHSNVRKYLPSLTPLFSLSRRVLSFVPPSARAFTYDALLRIGLRLYGPSISMTVFRLPFGLYLRRGSPALASKYHAEAHTLHMIEQSTSIPAPKVTDVLEAPRFAYLLMTRVPGRPIGQQFSIMTDEQVKQAVDDLKTYIFQLRGIARSEPEYQICNSQGGGILDWRIPDSQREELRFKNGAEFNKYLTDPFGKQTREKAAKSHDISHRIFFTHGDLNPKNFLAENGRITGIVDWENAGWFPEYWEYTKAHYSVRSLMRWLADLVDEVFRGYRDELHVENMLSDLLGPF